MRSGQQLLLGAKASFIFSSLLLAFALNIFQSIVFLDNAAWAPDWLAVVLGFWCVHQPRRIGFAWAFALGLLLDVNNGALLGEHALAYSCLAYIANLMHRRLLWFAISSQALHVIPLFLFPCLVSSSIRLMLGGDFPGISLIIPPFLQAALWPVASVLLLLPQKRAPDTDAHRPI